MKNKILMEVPASQKLTPLQLELLKIYSFELTEEELTQIKEVLAKFFVHRFTKHVAEVATRQGITDDKLDKWLNEPS